MQRYTTYIEIDLDAITWNIRAVKERVGAAQVMAVVKANAYGHGAVDIARAALDAGATWLGVARVIEGAQLREAGIAAPILVITYALPSEMQAAVVYDLTPTITEIETAQALSGFADQIHRTMNVHVKVDTGLGRGGLLPHEVVPFLNQVRTLPRLNIQGVFTHFATADDPDPAYTNYQFEVFKQVLSDIEAADFNIPIYHAANSAAIMYHPETHLDMVRVGVAMYGLRPNVAVKPAFEIRPALALKSHVARVKWLPAGSSVGYGRTFITQQDSLIALVAAGYGDGYHRLNSNRGAVLVRGKRAPVVGRVSMDQLMVDVTEVRDVQAGDEVVLIGRQGETRIWVEQVAKWTETINYEVTTSLLARVPRFYLKKA